MGYRRTSSRHTEIFRSARFRRQAGTRWRAYDLVRDYDCFPHVPGCYVFIVEGVAVYVGSTEDLNTRMRAHRSGKGAIVVSPRAGEVLVKCRPTRKWGDWAMLELRLIRRLRPAWNRRGNPCQCREPANA
jgi:predicted GIY-YIG superfamily endonuclease